MKTPSHVTILIWVKKIGIYKLSKPKEISDDWILMIDESIEFGHEKLLVILGVREATIEFGSALNYNDMTCLKLSASCSWKGVDINKVLEELTPQLGSIKYVVADMGNSIKKALKLSSIPHVEDVNHKISWFIKELYKDDDVFKEYTQQLAYLRGSQALSNMSHILPPRQRVDSRFMNLKPIFEWSVAILEMLSSETANEQEKEKMKFVNNYKPLVMQTSQLILIANRVQEILKNRGLSSKTKQECLVLFEGISDQRTLKFRDMIEDYLTNTIAKVGETDNILCSSDILESSFGKFKNYISNNSTIGITDLSLAIPAFGSDLGQDEIKKALEQVKVKGIKEWSKVNIGQTQTKKRRESLKMGGRKKSKTHSF